MWVHATITIWDNDFNVLHKFEAKSKIRLDETETEWDANDKAIKMWEAAFEPLGRVDIDDIWT